MMIDVISIVIIENIIIMIVVNKNFFSENSRNMGGRVGLLS